MRKRIRAMLGAAAMTFVLSALVTVLAADSVGACRSCQKKYNCPAGYCYVDCENCCYLWHGTVYCFK
ncbi:MAG TPA: hypothetical protein VNN55_09725 [bacterium]|nr:hypothetical protein [bacterium]